MWSGRFILSFFPNTFNRCPILSIAESLLNCPFTSYIKRDKCCLHRNMKRKRDLNVTGDHVRRNKVLRNSWRKCIVVQNRGSIGECAIWLDAHSKFEEELYPGLTLMLRPCKINFLVSVICTRWKNFSFFQNLTTNPFLFPFEMKQKELFFKINTVEECIAGPHFQKEWWKKIFSCQRLGY